MKGKMISVSFLFDLGQLWTNIKIFRILKHFLTSFIYLENNWVIRGTFGLCWVGTENDLFGVETLSMK